MTTTTALTPQAIVAVLRRAGFERSDSYRRSVTRHTAATGFRVWRTLSRSAPDVPVVAVAHFDAGQHADTLTGGEVHEVWQRHTVSAKHMLVLYAEAIRAEGYEVGRNFAAEDPYLIVAKRES